MRVLLYGEGEVYGSGAWCYLQSLKEMGHDTYFYSPFYNLESYKISFIYKAIKKVRQGIPLTRDYRYHTAQFLDYCKVIQPDIIIILKGLLIDREIIEKIKLLNIWVVLINHDDFFSVFKNNSSPMLLDAIAKYDYIFCTKQVNVEEIKILNKKTEFLMFAYYPKIHHPPVFSESDKQIWMSDVVFVGNSYRRRVKQLEYLIKHSQFPINLKVYGPNWNKVVSPFSPLRRFIQNKILGPEEMSKAIFYSNVSLGFLCEENRDDYTQRTFEIPAMKGLLLAERTNRHLKLFSEGEEAFFFETNNFDELVTQVYFLQKNMEIRKHVVEKGYHKVLSSSHAYIDRLNRIIDLYRQR